MKYKIFFLAFFVLPFLATAQEFNEQYPISVLTGIDNLISYAVPLFVAIALALFIWGLVVFIKNSGDEKALAEGKQKMVWGIIALFVIVSVWGIVYLLRVMTGTSLNPFIQPPQSTFEGGGGGQGGGGGGGGTNPCDDDPTSALCQN